MKVLILGDGLLGSELHSQTGWDVASRKKGNLPNLDNWLAITSLITTGLVALAALATTEITAGVD